jgi:hypothetical protein
MKVILIHNPFEILKPKTWLALIVRLFTKSYWNHCAVAVILDGVECVSDFQERYKLRPMAEWLAEDRNRSVRFKFVDTGQNDSWLIDQILFASGRYKGYDWLKLVNHLTKRKLGFTIFKENEKRFVCSEWIEFLLTGKQVNWAVPNDYR